VLVRNRFKDEESLFGIFKSVPRAKIGGLKGHGGVHVKSLFEEVAVVEEVQKMNK
jgi:hypothetical protein